MSDMLWFAFFSILAPDAVRYEVSDEPLLLPRVGRICLRDDPEGGCPERMEAQAQGLFYPDFEVWGYVMADIPLRQMSAQAKYYVYSEREDENHPNNSGQPYRFHECPWCFQELPSLGLLRKHQEKLAFDGQADGS